MEEKELLIELVRHLKKENERLESELQTRKIADLRRMLIGKNTPSEDNIGLKNKCDETYNLLDSLMSLTSELSDFVENCKEFGMIMKCVLINIKIAEVIRNINKKRV